MNATLLPLCTGGLILICLGLTGAAEPDAPGTVGPACSSCSGHGHVQPAPDVDGVDALLRRWQCEPFDPESAVLAELLYHADAVRSRLHDADAPRLDGARGDFLRRELRRDHARVELRIVDLDGVERARLAPTRVPLGVKQHLHPASHDLQAMDFSGTVLRTGLRHLWARY